MAFVVVCAAHTRCTILFSFANVPRFIWFFVHVNNVCSPLFMFCSSFQVVRRCHRRCRVSSSVYTMCACECESMSVHAFSLALSLHTLMLTMMIHIVHACTREVLCVRNSNGDQRRRSVLLVALSVCVPLFLRFVDERAPSLTWLGVARTAFFLHSLLWIHLNIKGAAVDWSFADIVHIIHKHTQAQMHINMPNIRYAFIVYFKCAL